MQVITVKAKYVVDNQTGMPIEIKQRGTPDLPPDFISEDNQCARKLAINERQATSCLRVVRPTGPSMFFEHGLPGLLGSDEAAPG